MVMYARKQPRLGDGCDRRDSQPYQTLKYSSKSHPGGDHRHEKMRDSSDVTPPCKMLRRSDSPENKYIDSTGHSRAKAVHTHRARDRDGGTSFSPQENSHNHSSLHSSNSHSNPSKTSDTSHEPGDDWSEHISSSGKKYYYNCRTEVSQWEKPKEWLEREQRQKDATKTVVNSFPKDRDYRREAMQASTAPTGSKSAQVEKPAATQSQSSSSSSGSLNPSSGPPGSSASTVPVSPVLQSSAPPLLQDPTLLRQLLPALQTALQLNNASVDMAKINEVLTAAVTQASLQSMLHKILTAGPSAFNITTILSQAAQLSNQAQQSNQSPMSLTSDASSPRSYVSPRISTPQTNAGPHKPLLSTQPVISQPKVSTQSSKQASHHQPTSQQPLSSDKQHSHDATTASPRTLHRQGNAFVCGRVSTRKPTCDELDGEMFIVRGVPLRVLTTSPSAAAAAAMPRTLPPLPPPPQQPGPPAPSPPPSQPTLMRILSNTCRGGLLSTRRNRHRDYVKRHTPWEASACLRTAPSSKTSGLWSESVKYKQHCASRGYCF
uniref:WW domain containing adaptor with coiled-coil a n=1 Tax=Scophthalmus maximus TaxID=52904 RepID=A0A8D2ZNN3_SCOMX